MWFPKISIPPPQRVIGNSKEGGGAVVKAKVFKGKHDPKLESPDRWGVQPRKNLHGGSMDIFWNNTTHTVFFFLGNFSDVGSMQLVHFKLF